MTTHVYYVPKMDRYDEHKKNAGWKAVNYNEYKTLLILSHSNLQSVMLSPRFYVMYECMLVLRRRSSAKICVHPAYT